MATVVTVTVAAAGGEYTSLSAAEAGEQRDLVAVDEQLDIACEAFEDTTNVTFAGWTTDATRFVRIYAADSHDGQWSTSVYRLRSYGSCLTISAAFTRVEGLQIQPTGDDHNLKAVLVSAGVEATLDGCILRGNPSMPTYGNNHAGVDGAVDRSAPLFVRNCLIYDFAVPARTFNAGVITQNHVSGKTYVQNCTIVNCTTGVRDTYGDIVVTNTVAYGCTTDFVGGFDSASDYNASGDATAPGANALTSIADPFVDAAGGDYHLAAGVALIDAGTDLSVDYTTDIDGDTRTGAWDIGADEWADTGGGGATLTVPLAVSSSVVHVPTVQRTATALVVPLAASLAAAYTPTIQLGGVALSPSRAESTSTAYAPTVQAGGRTLVAGLAGSASAAYAPSVVEGTPAGQIRPPRAESAATAYTPFIQAASNPLVIPRAESGAAAYAPTVTQATHAIAPPRAESVATAYAPNLEPGTPPNAVVLPRAESTAQAWAPTVQRAAVVIVAPRAGSSSAAYAPQVVHGIAEPVVIAVPRAESGGTAYPPTLIEAVVLTIPRASSTAIAHTPIVRAASVGTLRGRVRIVPAFGGTASLAPALSGRPDIVPALKGTPSITPDR